MEANAAQIEVDARSAGAPKPRLLPLTAAVRGRSRTRSPRSFVAPWHPHRRALRPANRACPS